MAPARPPCLRYDPIIWSAGTRYTRVVVNYFWMGHYEALGENIFF